MARFCTNCGAQSADTAAFCEVCGAGLSQGAPAQQSTPYAAPPVAPPQYAAPQYGGAGQQPQEQQAYQQPGVPGGQQTPQQPYQAQQYGAGSDTQPGVWGGQQYPQQTAGVQYGEATPPPPKKKKRKLVLIIILIVCVAVAAAITVGVLLVSGVIATLGSTAQLDYIKLGNDEVPTVKFILGEERNMTGMSTSMSGSTITKTFTYSVASNQDEDMFDYARALMDEYGYCNITAYDFSGRRGSGFEFGIESMDPDFVIIVRIDYDTHGYTITMTRARGTLTVYEGNDEGNGEDSNEGGEPINEPPSPRPPSPTPTTPEDPGDDPGASSTVFPGSGGSIVINGETACTLTPDQSGVWEIRTSNSGDSDPYIVVLDGRGNYVGEDDDNGGGYDALYSPYLNAGEEYAIIVYFYDRPTTTTTLSVTFLGAGAPQPPPVPGPADGGSLTGRGGSTRVDGPTSIPFSPDTTGVWVIFTSDNGNSDPMLQMLYSSGTVMSEDDDGWGDYNALIRVFIFAGDTYSIEVSFYSGSEGRNCTLNVIPPVEIPGGGGDVHMDHASGFLFTPSQSGSWEFRTSNNGSFDPRLAIYEVNSDDSIDMLANDDDSGDGVNAMARVELVAGHTYHILVQFHDVGYGTCTLSVNKR